MFSQPVATMLAALLILVGGVLVYRWQKHVDRETELLLERRRAYREYLIAASDLKYSIGWGTDQNPNELISRYYAMQDQLILISEEKIVSAVLDPRDAMRPLIKDWRSKGFSNLTEEENENTLASSEQQAYFDLLFVLRDDAFGMTRFTLKARVGDPSLKKKSTTATNE